MCTAGYKSITYSVFGLKYLLMHVQYLTRTKTGPGEYMLIFILAFSHHNF